MWLHYFTKRACEFTCHHFVGQRARCKTSFYMSQLDYEANKHYYLRLEIKGEKFPDPYSIKEDE